MVPDYISGFIFGAAFVGCWLAFLTCREWRPILLIDALIITILAIIIPFLK